MNIRLLLGFLVGLGLYVNAAIDMTPSLCSELEVPASFTSLRDPKNPLLSPIEWEELQLDDLATVIAEYASTSLGEIGLKWMLTPINSRTEIENRQQILKVLVEHDEILSQLEKILSTIKRGERPLLKKMEVPSAIDAVSYHMGKQIDAVMNRNANALETSAQFYLFVTPISLMYLAYKKIMDIPHNYNPQRMLVSEEQKGDLLMSSAIHAPSSPESPTETLVELHQGVSSTPPSTLQKTDITFMDGKPVKLENDTGQRITDMNAIYTWFARLGLVRSQSAQIHLDEAARIEREGSLGDRVCLAERTIFNKRNIGRLLIKIIFGNKYLETLQPEQGELNLYPWIYKGLAWCYVFGDQARSDLFVIVPLLLGYWTIKELWSTLIAEQARYAELAQATRSFKRLGNCIELIAEVAGSTIAPHAQQLINAANWDTDIAQLVALLEESTFDEKKLLLYLRGNVIKACHIHKAVDQKIIPFLQTIAEWDAYCALARLYKSVQERDTRYCFAEFIESEKPYIQISNGWTPLARANQPVGNDINIGVNDTAVRLFLTGPNGCGKSTYMKALMHGVVMAQSCGIVPGNFARVALFDGIRTSLHPQEDILKGISTFMAQKLRIDSVVNFAALSNRHNKVLVMFDEPFSGTIDSQIESRVYQLGQRMIQLPYAAACIATHVEQPTVLAAPRIFDTYQVEIKEPTLGEFVRTFKIKPGVARWWFADQAKVTRFVDWLGRYKQP